jgi:hypothetical protein
MRALNPTTFPRKTINARKTTANHSRLPPPPPPPPLGGGAAGGAGGGITAGSVTLSAMALALFPAFESFATSIDTLLVNVPAALVLSEISK